MRVFLHGFTGAAASWGPLTPGDLALALPGHGAPTAASWDEAVAQLAAHLHPRPHLVGYSLGGRLALGLLTSGVDVTRATVVGAHPGLQDPVARAQRVDADERLAQALLAQGIQPFVRAWEALPMWETQARVPVARREAQRAIRAAHDPAGLAASLRGQGLGRMPDLRPKLAKVHAPVDVVVGALDRKFLPLARELSDLLPQGRLHVVPHAGHNVPLEAPEAFGAILAA